MLLAITAPPAHVFTLRDARKLVSLSSPQMSPDGRRVVVLVSRNDYDKDETRTDMLLVDVRTHRARALVRSAADLSSPQWSPDGTRLAYIEGGQVYVMPMNGGEPLQLTREKLGVEEIEWRPDGRAIAFAAHIPLPNQAAIDRHEDEFVVDDDAWTAQGPPTRVQMYEIGVDGGIARRIGDGTWSEDGGFAYAKDGRSVFATRITDDENPNRYMAREIVRVNIASGRAVPIPKLSATQEEPMRGPDGRIAFGFANPRGPMQVELALARSDGTAPRWVTMHLDRNPEGATFLPDGSLVAVADDATQRNMFRITATGSVTRLPLGPISSGYDLSAARDGTIAFVGSTPTHPGELYILKAGAAAPARLTDFNSWIDRYALATMHPITWRTFDGLTADGVVTTPAAWHPNQRVPLVVYIHGGPTGASLTAFSTSVQLFAAHGWMVFQPNYRGSDNLGLEFARTTVPHITSVPGKDIEAGLAAVMHQYSVDPRRIAVSGWSEGGLMTSWLITHDTRWCAAVSGAAVNDWVQYDAMSDAKDFAPEFIGKSPWSSAAEYQLYEDESPLTYASRVRTPTLIMSDAGDYRVPTPLAYEFYHAVRATGTPVEFVVYPVVGHFPSDPVRIEDVYRRWNAWLEKYLSP